MNVFEGNDHALKIARNKWRQSWSIFSHQNPANCILLYYSRNEDVNVDYREFAFSVLELLSVSTTTALIRDLARLKHSAIPAVPELEL